MKRAKGWEIPLYGGKVFLARGVEEAQAIIDQLEVDEEVEDAKGVTIAIPLEDGYTFAYIVTWADGKVSTLAHEIDHVALLVEQHAGFVANQANGEPHCYLVSGIWDGLLPNAKLKE